MNSRFQGLVLLLSVAGASPALAEQYSEQHEEVKRLFQSDKEPTAKDAVWTAESMFKVGVLDDGTIRSGYAEYVCSVLGDYGIRNEGLRVQVIDIIKLTRSGKWESLGEADCV